MSDGNIGILGSGDVGQALGRGFAQHGWDVKIGTRSPDKLQEWVEEPDGTRSVGSFAEAAAHGNTAVVAVLGAATEDVLEMAGPENFTGTLVLDATNRLDFSVENPPGLLFEGEDSLGERVQSKLPDAAVVKCFNTVANFQMVDPQFKEGTPPMMICGDDEDAKNRTKTFSRISVGQALLMSGALVQPIT